MNFLLYLERPCSDHFRHRGIWRWQYRRPLPRKMAGSARPAAEESRGGGSDLRSAGRLLRPGPGLRDCRRVGAVRRRPMPMRLPKRRRWRASTNSARLSPNRCAPSSIRSSSNTRTGSIDKEWPEMADNTFQGGKVGAHELWATVLAYHPTGQPRANADGQVDRPAQPHQPGAQPSGLTTTKQDLPSVVWTVIYLGCLMTIGFSYFFGSNVFRAQVLMCGFFSILLGMTILAILELAHPYQGVVTISERALSLRAHADGSG